MKKFFLIILALFSLCFGKDSDGIRNFYMPLAAAAYSDTPNQCISNILKHWANMDSLNETLSLYRQYNFKCDSLNDTCSGFIAIYLSENAEMPAFIVSFKGATKFEQFYQQNWNYNEMENFVGGGKVSKQFLDAFNGIWINAGMKDDILSLKNKYPNSYFYLVGHSSGGAMATLAATTMVTTGISSRVIAYTYGQPRTGDKNFAISVDLKVIVYRIIHNADIVPHLPSLNSSAYYHHAEEYWYHNDMGINDTFSECSFFEGEARNCSDSIDATKLTFDDHKIYYGRNIVDYGINGCPDLATSKRTNIKKHVF